jgi:hypothetical protein
MEDIMAITLHKQIIGRPIEGVWYSSWKLVDRVSEWFWFLLSFILFVVLGPFSAPVVLIALYKLGLEDNDHQEPELISS